MIARIEERRIAAFMRCYYQAATITMNRNFSGFCDAHYPLPIVTG